MKAVRPRNWSEFQHYADRRPTWIKFHVALLDNYEYSQLKPEAMLFLHHFWLLYARSSKGPAEEAPIIPADPKHFAKQMPGKVTPAQASRCLTTLIEQRYIETFDATLDEADLASTSASNGASKPASRPASKPASKLLAQKVSNSSVLISSPPRLKKEETEADACAREVKNYSGIQAVIAAYPTGAGRFDWLTAEHHCQVLIETQHETWQSLTNSAQRYAVFCSKTERIGTQFVTNPAKFFGDESHWKAPWTPPQTPAEQREQVALQKLADRRVAVGLGDFRLPHEGETSDQYRAAQDAEWNRRKREPSGAAGELLSQLVARTKLA